MDFLLESGARLEGSRPAHVPPVGAFSFSFGAVSGASRLGHELSRAGAVSGGRRLGHEPLRAGARARSARYTVSPRSIAR